MQNIWWGEQEGSMLGASHGKPDKSKYMEAQVDSVLLLGGILPKIELWDTDSCPFNVAVHNSDGARALEKQLALEEGLRFFAPCEVGRDHAGGKNLVIDNPSEAGARSALRPGPSPRLARPPPARPSPLYCCPHPPWPSPARAHSAAHSPPHAQVPKLTRESRAVRRCQPHACSGWIALALLSPALACSRLPSPAVSLYPRPATGSISSNADTITGRSQAPHPLLAGGHHTRFTSAVLPPQPKVSSLASAASTTLPAVSQPP
eukprot:168887-Prymnesium_polylepis.1